MGWKCLLGHTWKIKGSSRGQYLIINPETFFLKQCTVCNKFSWDRVRGRFELKEPDMTPDEYYSMITKD